ncbi:MAG: hypothetical protein H5T66_04900 [Chloroflexi bacterium]|nr:hypothetical protein [Chloroflexota bacterium]
MGCSKETACLEQDIRPLLRRHAAWWERRGMLYAEVPHEPLGDLWLPLADGSLADRDLDLQPEMLDLDRLAGPTQERGPLNRWGDLIEARGPYARIPWVEAILGCPIRATIKGGSMRSQAFIASWEEWPKHRRKHHRGWHAFLLRLTEALAVRANGRYAVTQPLMRGPSDLAEAVLGPEMTCFSLYDHPAELQGFLWDVTDVFIEVLREQAARLPPLEGGYVNWFGIWAPGTVVRTQCDASAFLSAQQYARWFLPHDVRTSEAADYAIIHLHSGCLHTVEALLEVERPQAIQISLDPEPSGPPVRAILNTCQKILEKKPLVVDGEMTEADVALLLEALPHDGLCLIARKASRSAGAPWRPA